MQTKILFIDVYIDILTWGIYYNPGVASIVATLKQNGINPEHRAVFNKSDVTKLLKYIGDNKIPLVGFTVTEPILESVADVARKIREKYPNVYILCGGLHCILDPEDVFKRTVCDAVCVGEGEYPTLKLIKSLETRSPKIHNINNLWFRKKNKIIKNPLDTPIDINALPAPNRDVFVKHDLDVYQGNIYLKPDEKGCVVTVSRGCHFNCSFCGNWFQNSQYRGKYRRVLDPAVAVNQLKAAVKKRHHDYIIFIDALFPTNNDWLEKFTHLYKKEINIPFTVQLRFGTITDKTVALLKNAGCYFVQIGLESGDGDIRYKVLNKKIDCQLIISDVEKWKKKQIKIGLNNMIGLPDETPDKFINTIQTNALLDVDFSYLFIFYPYKGTELYKYCLKHGLLRKQTKHFFLRSDTMLKLKTFKKQDILYYYNHFHTLVSLYKKYLKSHKTKLLWETLFKTYSICPSERRGVLKLFITATEKLFFAKIPNYL